MSGFLCKESHLRRGKCIYFAIYLEIESDGAIVGIKDVRGSVII